jgi:hypothetical protein
LHITRKYFKHEHIINNYVVTNRPLNLNDETYPYYHSYTSLVLLEMFEYTSTKGVIELVNRRRDRQYNGKKPTTTKKQNTTTNNNQQRTTQKNKD